MLMINMFDASPERVRVQWKHILQEKVLGEQPQCSLGAIMTTKSRLLFLLKYLYENTDDNHAISTNDLIGVLESNGFKANRKTVKDDVEMLIEADHDRL